MSNFPHTTGLSFDLALLQSTQEQTSQLQSLSNQRRLAELRAKFIKALSVDRKLVFAQYKSYYFENVTNRDFDGSRNAFELAEIVALEEAIDYAEKLEEQDSSYKLRDYKETQAHNWENMY